MKQGWNQTLHRTFRKRNIMYHFPQQRKNSLQPSLNHLVQRQPQVKPPLEISHQLLLFLPAFHETIGNSHHRQFTIRRHFHELGHRTGRRHHHLMSLYGQIVQIGPNPNIPGTQMHDTPFRQSIRLSENDQRTVQIPHSNHGTDNNKLLWNETIIVTRLYGPSLHLFQG